MTVTFSHYGADIPPSLALHCTSLAIRDARINHRSKWNQAIAKSELIYTKPPLVVLGVFPRAAMTWNMLFYSMLLVDQFARDYESMAFHFEVEISGMQGLVAAGNLSILPENGS